MRRALPVLALLAAIALLMLGPWGDQPHNERGQGDYDPIDPAGRKSVPGAAVDESEAMVSRVTSPSLPNSAWLDGNVVIECVGGVGPWRQPIPEAAVEIRGAKSGDTEPILASAITSNLGMAELDAPYGRSLILSVIHDFGEARKEIMLTDEDRRRMTEEGTPRKFRIGIPLSPADLTVRARGIELVGRESLYFCVSQASASPALPRILPRISAQLQGETVGQSEYVGSLSVPAMQDLHWGVYLLPAGRLLLADSLPLHILPGEQFELQIDLSGTKSAPGFFVTIENPEDISIEVMDVAFFSLDGAFLQRVQVHIGLGRSELELHVPGAEAIVLFYSDETSPELRTVRERQFTKDAPLQISLEPSGRVLVDGESLKGAAAGGSDAELLFRDIVWQKGGRLLSSSSYPGWTEIDAGWGPAIAGFRIGNRVYLTDIGPGETVLAGSLGCVELDLGNLVSTPLQIEFNHFPAAPVLIAVRVEGVVIESTWVSKAFGYRTLEVPVKLPRRTASIMIKELGRPAQVFDLVAGERGTVKLSVL